MLGGDRQPEPAAAPAARRVELGEPFEDALEPIGRDARSPVGHGDDEVLPADVDLDLDPGRGRVLTGVVEEVAEDPLEAPRVRVDERRGWSAG